MNIGIYSKDFSTHSAKEVKKILDFEGFTCSITKRIKNFDLVIVLGGDKGVRNYFHHTPDDTIPVLGIGDSESSGFLAQIDFKEFPSYLHKLKKQSYTIEQVPRLGVRVDGKSVYPVLNDVAIFPSKSAVLMEHTLTVNGAQVWHDSSDGIIVSTPIGSSAYSMSAGGPVIFQDSNVFGIVSVNSLNVNQRPLIVSHDSVIGIDDISSYIHCEVILDGINRYDVKKTVDCSAFLPPVKIIRLKKNSTAISALAKKAHLAQDILSMAPSSKLILQTIEYEGPLTPKQLAARTLLPGRTVRLALYNLLRKGYLKRKVYGRDSRQKIYEIAKMH